VLLVGNVLHSDDVLAGLTRRVSAVAVARDAGPGEMNLDLPSIFNASLGSGLNLASPRTLRTVLGPFR
jgi:hypothetical protein